MVELSSRWLASGLGIVAVAAVIVMVAPNASAFAYPLSHSTHPDAGKYVFVSSADNIKGMPAYNWMEIGQAGNKVAWASGSTGYVSQSASTYTLPFPLKLYSQSLSSFYVCSAGVLAFTGGYYTCPTYYYSSGSYVEYPGPYYYVSNAIAPHYGPLYVNPSVTSAAVYHATLGVSPNRVDVTEWNTVQYCIKDAINAGTGAATCANGAGSLTFQVQIWENGHIEFQYKHMDLTGVPATLSYNTMLTYGYGATQEGLNAAGTNYCYGYGGASGTCTNGMSFRMSCEQVTTYYSCNTKDDYPSGPGYCYSDCNTYGAPDGFVVEFYKNTPAVGSDLTITTAEDHAVRVVPGADPEGRASFVHNGTKSLLYSVPQHGTVALVDPTATDDGYYLYTPDQDYNGPDSFSFVVSDGFVVGTTPYKADITVTPVDDAPVGVPDSLEAWEYPRVTDVTDNLLANDRDVERDALEGPNGKCLDFNTVVPCTGLHQAINVGSSTTPANAAPGAFVARPDGSVRYGPKSGVVSDQFTYDVCDDNAASLQHPTEPATNPRANLCTGPVAVDIQIRDYRLRALRDDYVATEDQAFKVNAAQGVAANDPGQLNATALNLVGATTTAAGSIVLDPTGAFVYTPSPDFCGKAEWSYRLTGPAVPGPGTSLGNRAVIHLDVLCVDDPPVFSAASTHLKFKPGVSFNDRSFLSNRQVVQTLCCKPGLPAGQPFKVATSILAGPCTGPGTEDECLLQRTHLELSNDNPQMFSDTGQPTLKLFTETKWSASPYFTPFFPTYGWLNFTTHPTDAGLAHLNACVVDDGIVAATANAPGSIDRRCITVIVDVPGPAISQPDDYDAFAGHLLETTKATGVLANDADYAKRPVFGPPGTDLSNLVAQLATVAAHAETFHFDSDGSFIYKPLDGFEGTDSFTYLVKDGDYTSNVPVKVTLHVRVAASPGADFQWMPLEPHAGDVVAFQDLSRVPGSTIKQWAWDFDDGESALTTNPQHVFKASGAYAVRLQIVDSKGDTAELRQTVRVRGASDLSPTLTHQAPRAIAGSDFAVNEGELVQLAGSADPLETISSWTWRQTDGPLVTLVDPNTMQPTFTAPALIAGQDARVRFQLTVFDGVAESAPSNVTVLVTSTNQAPHAKAAGPARLTGGQTATLDGTASADANGDALAYQWTQVGGPTVELKGARTATASFTAPDVTAAVALRFELHVSDQKHPDAVDTTEVVVAPAGAPDLVIASEANPAQPGLFRFVGGSPTATWEFGDGQTATGPTSLHTYQPGTYTVTLRDGTQTATTQVMVAAPLGKTHANQSPAAGFVVILAGLAGLVVACRRRA